LIGTAYDCGVDVDLRLLRTLAAIAEEGTFGRAARRLSYTQSSVSQQVAVLERAVGGPVFDRPGGPRAVRLTPLGQLVLDRGRRLLRAADELGDAVERFRAGAGRIDIGTTQSVSTVILPALVSRLRAEYPDCEVRLSEDEPEDPRIGELDLLFSDGSVAVDAESVALLDDPYVLVARRGEYPDGPVAVADLDGAELVAWPPTCDQPQVERAMAERGARPRIVFRSANNETLLAMVRTGVGCAVLPRLAVAGARDDPRLRVHPLDPAPSRRIHLHRPTTRWLSPAATRAVELAREIADELSDRSGGTPDQDRPTGSPTS
jgi:DNA-binding transcriptional LysR family regulator